MKTVARTPSPTVAFPSFQSKFQENRTPFLITQEKKHQKQKKRSQYKKNRHVFNEVQLENEASNTIIPCYSDVVAYAEKEYLKSRIQSKTSNFPTPPSSNLHQLHLLQNPSSPSSFGLAMSNGIYINSYHSTSMSSSSKPTLPSIHIIAPILDEEVHKRESFTSGHLNENLHGIQPPYHNFDRLSVASPTCGNGSRHILPPSHHGTNNPHNYQQSSSHQQVQPKALFENSASPNIVQPVVGNITHEMMSIDTPPPMTSTSPVIGRRVLKPRRATFSVYPMPSLSSTLSNMYTSSSLSSHHAYPSSNNHGSYHPYAMNQQNSNNHLSANWSSNRMIQSHSQLGYASSPIHGRSSPSYAHETSSYSVQPTTASSSVSSSSMNLLPPTLSHASGPREEITSTASISPGTSSVTVKRKPRSLSMNTISERSNHSPSNTEEQQQQHQLINSSFSPVIWKSLRTVGSVCKICMKNFKSQSDMHKHMEFEHSMKVFKINK